MTLLAIDITQGPATSAGIASGQLMVAVSYAGVRRVHWATLPFENAAALPAVLKALEQSAFRPQAFWDAERVWLREAGYLVEGNGDQVSYSARMRRAIGERLFGFLFPAAERSLYDHARWQATERGEEVHLQLRFDADAETVAALPWELLWHDGDFLIGGGRGTLTRYLSFDSPPPARSVPGRLKLLMIGPRPTELMTLGEAEAEAIRQAVTPMVEEGRIAVDGLSPPSFSELKTYLRDHAGDELPHVVHFDGHGVFGRRCSQCGRVQVSRRAEACPEGHPLGDGGPQGYLAFEDARHRTEYVSATEFADQLRMAAVLGPARSGDRGAGGICLVVLSACGSAVARGGESVFNGVAQRLMDAGVAAVVAMQFSIEAGAAAEFARYLYASVAQGIPLVTATSLARTALGREGDQWYRPVLYLRWRDNEGGRLFAPAAKPDHAAVAAQAGPRLLDEEAQARQPFEPETVVVAAGEFIMGGGEQRSARPAHPVSLPLYRIGRYPVSNQQYESFVRDSGHRSPPDWQGHHCLEGTGDHPVVNVSWHDAVAYCRWLGERTGKGYRLPTEAEWEKAASWDPENRTKRRYPWGDQFDSERCNTQEGGAGRTTPVAHYSPAGDSAYGAADMAGNVWEWCRTLPMPYPYSPEDEREDPMASGRRVVRGGSWHSEKEHARCAYRRGRRPDQLSDRRGFRVVLAPTPS